jgi:pilus assembly protein CpaE
LIHADEIVVVLNPDLVSLRNAAALLKLIATSDDVRGRTHVVLNRAGLGGGLDEATIRKQLGQELAAVLPEDPSLATYALNRGVPFIVSHPRALLSRRIEGLLDQLSIEQSKEQPQGQPKIGALPTLALPGPVAPSTAKKSRASSGLLSYIGL